MKLATTILAASLIASVNASGLRAKASEAAIATTASIKEESENDARELLSSWCDPATPVLWHPDYSRPWPSSGCVQKADCDSPGYADAASCCAAQYGGQTAGACTSSSGLTASPTASPTANPNAGKWYADYATPWPIAGCKNTTPHPSYATTFFDTQLLCCKGAYAGQPANSCINGLAVAPTAAPTTTGGVGGKWYADYGTAWSNAGCKSSTPYPVYASTFFDSQLLCCKGAFGGQSSNACVKGLPSPPTSTPTVAPTTSAPTTKSPTTVAGQGGGWYADYGTAWPTAGCKNTLPLPVYATTFYSSQLECCKGAYGGQTSEACIKGLPSPPTSTPTASPTFKPTSSPSTSKPTSSPTTSKPTATPTAKPV